MIIRTATAALALTIVAAGTFAFATGATATQQNLQIKPAAAMSTMEKNQAWPVKGNITMEPCTLNFCQEV